MIVVIWPLPLMVLGGISAMTILIEPGVVMVLGIKIEPVRLPWLAVGVIRDEESYDSSNWIPPMLFRSLAVIVYAVSPDGITVKVGAA